ncbi:MAG: acyl-CoA dehydrogenase family protein [Proteobacteria bacterium]|nr:acyl-CoA dehydrogenase family protein [Pseudomonadota bacterium]
MNGGNAQIPTLEAVAEGARALLPMLRGQAAATEANRTVLPATVEALHAAGLTRICQPARFGGYELGWDAPVVLGRILASACPSTAWLVSIVGPHAAYVGRFPLEAQEEVWRDGKGAVLAGATVARGGKIRRDGDGLRLDGQFAFASGVDHAPWGFVIGTVEDDGDAVTCLLPRRDFEIADTWHVAGLRGTGTKDMVFKDAYVPPHLFIKTRDLVAPEPPGAQHSDAALYRIEYVPYVATTLMGPLLGAAEGALQAYTESTKTRVGALFGDRPAASLSVQLRLAESAAEFRAAELMVEAQMSYLRDRAAAREPVPQDQQIAFARDRAYVTRLCVTLVHRLVQQMGASGLYDSNPVQRMFRDLSAMSQQFGVGWDRNMAPAGRLMLGIENETQHFWKT